MIVADTGNNRIQIFRVEKLALPNETPSEEELNSPRDRILGASSRSGRFASSSTAKGTRSSSDTGSLMEWAQAQAPARQSADEAGRRVPDEGQSPKVGRGEGFRELPITTSRSRKENNYYCDHAEDCLLVFNGGNNIGRLRKRCTAGETEEGEGPLRQPCDLSFWRANRGEEHTPRAWKPSVPPWFRFRDRGDADEDGAGSPVRQKPRNGTRSDFEVKAMTLAESLSSSLGNDGRSKAKHPGVPEGSTHPRRGSHGRGGGACDIINWKDIDGASAVGSFVVRETRTLGELHLIFVDRTKVLL